MEYTEIYKGHVITITTGRFPGGGWTASARVELSANKTVTVQPDRGDSGGDKPFTSEEDARGAALRAAVAEIDRSRASVGKP
jgi:hypothetical protein